MAVSRSLRNGLSLLISGLLLSAGIWIAGADRIINDFKQFPVWVVGGVLIAFALNLAVVTFRLGRLLEYFGVNVPCSIVSKASLQGHFASLFFISLFGQVAGRHAVLRRYGTPPVFIASLTAIERVVLFIVSGALCLMGAAWVLDRKEILDFLGSISLTQMALAAILSLVASVWFGKSRFETRLFAGMRTNKSIGQFFELGVITFVAQGLVLGAFVIGGAGLAPEIGFWNLLAAAAITSFAASLPISVNGWGVRELAAVFAFGQIGVPPSSALAISILVGLCSTAVVLAAFPYVFSQKNGKGEELISSGNETPDRLPIEKTATWWLVMMTAVLVFFQVHVPLQDGVINLNLADAFAVLALASVVLHSLYTRSPPHWSVPRFNLLLAMVGVLLLFAFLNGMQTIGVTQWALVGRLFGWLVLLGYLSVGVLTINNLGRSGVRRFIETLVATAVVIVLFHAVTRSLAYSGWIDPGILTQNFQGFSGNRNAFAFQLLVCSVLLLAYSRYRGESCRRLGFGLCRVRQDLFLAVAHGVIMAGVVFTGSRAGILTGIILLGIASVAGLADRGMLLRSLIYGFVVWLVFIWILPWISQLLVWGLQWINQLLVSEWNIRVPAGYADARFTVQSMLSNEASNVERWETIRRGYEMWRDAPWLGAGLGVFIESSTQWFKEPIVIHSTPVWILAEFGLLGAAILISMLMWLLLVLVRSGLANPRDRAVIMLLAIFVIFGIVHEIFYQRIFWLVLGICMALPLRDRFQQTLTRTSVAK